MLTDEQRAAEDEAWAHYIERRKAMAEPVSSRGGAVMGASIALIGMLVLSAVGCVSPYKESSGKYLRVVAPEERSPFGTNFVFGRMQRCDGPETRVLFYLDADFTNCEWLSLDEQVAWQHGYSQGQGGQIVSGAMNAGAVGAIAATSGGSSAAATVTNTIIQPRPHGRR